MEIEFGQGQAFGQQRAQPASVSPSVLAQLVEQGNRLVAVTNRQQAEIAALKKTVATIPKIVTALNTLDAKVNQIVASIGKALGVRVAPASPASPAAASVSPIETPASAPAAASVVDTSLVNPTDTVLDANGEQTTVDEAIFQGTLVEKEDDD